MPPPEAPLKPPEPPEPPAPEAAGLTILDIFGSAEKVELKRWNEDTLEWKYVRRLSRGEFEQDPDFIGRKWGGGWYDVHEINGKDYGKRQVRIWYDENEWGPAKGSHPAVPNEPATPPPEQANTTAATIMAATAALSPLVREIVGAIKGAPPAPAVSPLAALKEMADVMKSMMPPAQALDADATVKRAMEMLNVGMALGVKVGGGTDWAGIIDKSGLTLEKIVTAAVALKGGEVKRLSAPAGGNGNGHVDPPGKAVNDPGPLFRIACAQIAEMASKSMLPERAAQEILGFIPAAFFDEFAERLRDQDMVKLVTTAHSGLSAHVDWLNRVIAALKPLVEEIEQQRNAAPAT